MISNVVNIRGLDSKIEAMHYEAVRLFPEGITTNDSAKIVAERLTKKDIKGFIDLMSRTIERMAILVKVTYSPENKIFTLDFRTSGLSDDERYGKVVELGLVWILLTMFTYRKSLEASVIAALLFTLVQKYEEVA